MKPDDWRPEPASPAIDDRGAAPDAAAHRERVAALWLAHERALLGMLVARVGSVEEAREIAQEAFVKLLALNHARAVSFLEGYLWKIAQNLVIDRVRQRLYREEQRRTLANEPEQAAPSPEGDCVASQRVQMIRQAIEELPEKCKRAFTLRVLNELPFDVVAQRMGIDVSGVKKYVAKALAHCRRAIDQAERAQCGANERL